MPKQKIILLTVLLSSLTLLGDDFDDFLEQEKKKLLLQEETSATVKTDIPPIVDRTEREEEKRRKELGILGTNQTLTNKDNSLEVFEISSNKFISIIYAKFSSKGFFMKVMKKLEKEYQLDKRTTSILERTELPEYFGEIEISIDRLNNLRSFILKDEAKNNVFIFKRDTNETEFRTTTSKKTKNIKKKELRPFFERFEKILGEDEYTSTEHVSFVRGKKKEITEIFQIGRYVSFLDTTTFTPNSTYENRTPKERKIKIRWDIKTIFFEGVDIFTEGYSPLNALLSENPQGEIEIEINNEYGMEENILALLKAMKKIGTNRAYVEKINKDLKRRGIRLLF